MIGIGKLGQVELQVRSFAGKVHFVGFSGLLEREKAKISLAVRDFLQRAWSPRR